MMPHIIFLLLIASSPFFIQGDETASWGTLSSGPSESECRPYIEKALQGASIHDSTSQPGDADDVGGTGTQEEAITQSEVSELTSSEVPSDGEEKENQESEGPAESDEGVENESKNESVEQVASDEVNDKQPSEEISDNIHDTSTEMEADVVSGENTVEEAKSEETSEAQADGESHEEQAEVQPEITLEGEEPTGGESVEEESGAHSTEESSHELGPNVEESDASAEQTAESTETINTETEESLEEITESPSETLESQEEPEQPASKVEEATSNESVEEEKESIPTDQEESSEDNIAQSLEMADEAASASQEVDEETEILSNLKEETKESSETSQQLDERSEEATDKNTEEERDVQPEESGEETIEKHAEDEELPAPESMVEADVGSGETEQTHAESEEETAPSEAAASPDSDESGTQESEPQIAEPEGSAEETPESQESTETPDVRDSEEATETSVQQAKEMQQDSVSDDVTVTEQVEKEEAPGESTVHLEGEEVTEQPSPEEELSMAIELPEKLRSREHMAQILRLNEENEETEKLLSKTIEHTLRELKKLYDVAIKPLEILYKYRDLSNRHFGDPEIFSKPLILFMGPWSGGKSTIINYLLENEYKKTALRTGAEPSPAYFNIVMWGEHEEVLDGTQLAADWTFSGLQKFGQGLLDRLRGLRLNHPLLQKVNIVEIPGILEIRKQVERLFPFNDACQWFIDRADIIFLVYDPSKLDVGPETEAILDQLKGREMQTRIILNKADQVKPEELMRVQGTLIWNISPLMSSTEPPIMYSTSLWSIPYEIGAPTRLLYAQEKAFLKDLRDAMDKRVENKIASARRFAVRVRNHAKMVDCYLTTYYNHKSFFGNKKKISDDIIEHPQNYHIYEGLSTLTNISRYDLPDPDVYRDFFRLNPVYEFQQLSSTCTYFRGCPINRLDVAIAYDLPELVGKYKKQVEEVLSSVKK